MAARLFRLMSVFVVLVARNRVAIAAACALTVLFAAEAHEAARAGPPTIGAISSQRAGIHPMRYFVSLPHGWSAGRAWPVLVVIPDAHRDFEANLERFVSTRGDRSYIMIAPEVLSCGGAASRTRARYSYGAAEWDSLEGGDDFAFEDAGIAAVIADVHERWGGETRAFLTGWEAGGHTVWAQLFRHPERWRGVAPVSTNYQRRGVPAAGRAAVHAPALPPVQAFRCGSPTGEAIRAMPFVEQQTALALRDARERGLVVPPVRVIAGADHGPLPKTVLAWCDSLRGSARTSVRTR